MGGLISVGVGVVAALLLWRTEHPVLFWSAIASTVVQLWSFGVMHNYAMELARSRLDRLRDNVGAHGGDSESLARLETARVRPSSREIQSVPNWITTVNMLATLAVVALFICGVVVRLF